MLVIIDYGVGNLGSIQSKLQLIKLQSKISNDPQEIRLASKLILPGVGHFGYGMDCLEKSGLVNLLKERVFEAKVPMLGICLGMQLFSEGSEEGQREGLGWIKGRVMRFRFEGENSRLPIPHMGWNEVKRVKPCSLFNSIESGKRFYFANSFHWTELDTEFIAGTTSYGYEFPSTIVADNIMGTQFHPEKSHMAGLQVIRNFAEGQIC